MNVELLRRVAAVIQEKPAEFDMRLLHVDTTTGDYVHPAEFDCNTAHCIAGWTEILTGERVDAVTVSRVWGTNRQSTQKLCFVAAWPKNFKSRYAKAKQNRTRARIAAARIEHFIETGGRE